jgi:hypothetical protein
MINYAKHDEEFHGTFKLVNGDEVLGKAVLTEDNGETIAFIQDPVSLQMVTKELEDGRTIRGVGFAKWMQFSDEDFYIVREKDILSVASMSRESILMYEAYLLGEDGIEKQKENTKTELNKTVGYLGKIDEARKLFERIYKS